MFIQHEDLSYPITGQLSNYDKIIKELDPTYVDAWLNKGIALGELSRYKEAIKCYDEIIEKLDPKYVNAWLNKGSAFDKLTVL